MSVGPKTSLFPCKRLLKNLQITSEHLPVLFFSLKKDGRLISLTFKDQLQYVNEKVLLPIKEQQHSSSFSKMFLSLHAHIISIST